MDYTVDIEARKKKEAKERTKIESLLRQRWREFGNTDAGLAILDDLFTMFPIYHTSYAGDTNDTFRNIGLREAGLRILDRIQKADPNIYIKLLQKRMKENKA